MTYNNRVVITVDIKAGVDAKFVKETSIKAEGRVASYINAADNPKTGAAYYKNALEGTAYGNDNHNYNAIVPATYLDTLPPSNYDIVQNWHDFQLTRPQNMSNAKLVAEWYRLNTLLEDKETGWHYPLVTMHRYWDIEGEIIGPNTPSCSIAMRMMPRQSLIGEAAM